MARAGRRSFAPRRIHQFDWARSDFDLLTLAAAATKGILVFAVDTLNRDVVVERTLVSVLVESDQAAAREQQVVAFGAVIVSLDAFAAGAASIPGPFSDPDADWLLHVITVGAGDASSSVMTSGQMLESRARRRLPSGHGVAFMAETGDVGSGADGVTIFGGVSILVRVRGT